ncbi:MAG: Glu/Leu/Phe/Val dehydrogenase [bacterium]
MKINSVYDNFKYNYENAISQFRNDQIFSILAQPFNEIQVNFPVKRDNGNIEMFTGYRVQHNNMTGPYYGGIRFHPSVSMEEIKSLSVWMTLKTALMGIPLSGSAGGINFNPYEYSDTEIERISRRFIYNLGSNLGADYDIVGPDINTDSQIMAWMLDTSLLSVKPHMRNANRHAVTGKPVKLGGTLGSEESSGQAIYYIIERWLRNNSIDMNGLRVIVQGLGSSGFWAAKILKRNGADIIAVENYSGAVFNENGLNINLLKSHIRDRKPAKDYTDGSTISHEEFMQLKGDVFISSALENQINSKNAGSIDVKLIVEGANGATTPDGDKILEKRGIPVIPGILANSGRMIVDYFEWLQNKRSEYWLLSDINRKLGLRVIDAYERIEASAAEHRCNLRQAAYIEALDKLQKVYRDRGIYP